MTLDEMIALIQAHKEGKPIESRVKIPEAEWREDLHPLFDFAHTDYRIKPEPHYRPFKNAEEVMEAIKEHGGWVYNGLYMCKFNYVTNYGVGIIKVNELMFKRAFELCTFADGTPFGVEE